MEEFGTDYSFIIKYLRESGNDEYQKSVFQTLRREVEKNLFSLRRRRQHVTPKRRSKLFVLRGLKSHRPSSE
jgi:hypothetical protein